MPLLHIHLPDDAQRLADEQIARGRFETVGDYIASLIRRDRWTAQLDEHQSVLKARLRSGPPAEMADDDFEVIRTRLETEIARRPGA
jgi:Arc/MetJ-type ribon-helix-helix transcriptional regulator